VLLRLMFFLGKNMVLRPEILLQEGWIEASIAGFNGNPAPIRNVMSPVGHAEVSDCDSMDPKTTVFKLVLV